MFPTEAKLRGLLSSRSLAFRRSVQNRCVHAALRDAAGMLAHALYALDRLDEAAAYAGRVGAVGNHHSPGGATVGAYLRKSPVQGNGAHSPLRRRFRRSRELVFPSSAAPSESTAESWSPATVGPLVRQERRQERGVTDFTSARRGAPPCVRTDEAVEPVSFRLERLGVVPERASIGSGSRSTTFASFASSPVADPISRRRWRQ